MKKQVLILEFHDKNGEVVKQLSKCPAVPEQIGAALSFITEGCDFVVSVQEKEVDEKTGKIIENPFENE